MSGGERIPWNRLSLQALVSCVVLLSLGSLPAETEVPRPNYTSPRPNLAWLSHDDLTMLALERERLANYLAAYVLRTVARSHQTDRELWSQRLLGLALALHPQNPRARAADTSLARGAKAPPIDAEHEPDVLSRWFFQRASTLQNGTKTDQLLAPYFVAAAAHMDPHYDEAVVALEKRRLHEGALDWKPICGEPEATSEP